MFDDLPRDILSSITNIHFDGNDLAWTQASLTVKYGHLGIRSAVQLALVFLASTAGSSDLVHQILPFHLHIISYPARDAAALASWTHGFDQLPPPISAAHHQKEWDTSKVRATADSLLNGGRRRRFLESTLDSKFTTSVLTSFNSVSPSSIKKGHIIARLLSTSV